MSKSYDGRRGWVRSEQVPGPASNSRFRHRRKQGTLTDWEYEYTLKVRGEQDEWGEQVFYTNTILFENDDEFFDYLEKTYPKSYQLVDYAREPCSEPVR